MVDHDFIRPQIQEGLRLALPEGLKDLMSDISREVLRAQPQNLYKFIADYLSALMVARENLALAARVCDSVCSGDCNPELEDELRYIGLEEFNIGIAKNIILDYFEKGEVNEKNVMIKIAKKTGIDESLLPAMQGAIRNAFKRHLVNNTVLYETSSDSDMDDVARATQHTLRLYRRTKHSPEEYSQAAIKIQAAYRAYGVRRHNMNSRKEPSKTAGKEKPPQRNITFDDEKTKMDGSFKACMRSASSTSLAGSYLKLPQFVPYTVHAPGSDEVETENSSVYYTNEVHEEEAAASGRKKISFQDSPNIEDTATLADDESDCSIEEILSADI